MSLTKRWLEEVSESMGLAGKINNKVIQKAQDRAAHIMDEVYDQARDEVNRIEVYFDHRNNFVLVG